VIKEKLFLSNDQTTEAENIAQTILRPELFTILQQASATQRYTGLGLSPESIKGQNVKIHTLRLIIMANNLPVDEETKKTCIKTLAIHDLPETAELIRLGRTSDTTAPQKALSPHIDKQVEKNEEKTARIIFTLEELTLYLAFSQAKDFLKNKNQNLPTTTGLISKILDKIDGDLIYHQMAITNSTNYQSLNAKAQSLAFEQYLPFSQKLDLLSGTNLSKIKSICQDFIDNDMLSIKELWNKIPPEQIPSNIKTYLDNFHIYNSQKQSIINIP
jgi:5'-deoxynucleotidase YfbR-like HD superfamily hydrolase